MKHKSKYAAIGYVVSKLVVPAAKKGAKRAAKKKAKGAVSGTTGAVRRNPAKTSVVVGTVLGAVGWVVTRSRSSDDTQD